LPIDFFYPIFDRERLDCCRVSGGYGAYGVEECYVWEIGVGGGEAESGEKSLTMEEAGDGGDHGEEYLDAGGC
jgi:hypothetical protein